ncbi:MAG: hypothetical protein JSS42_09490 [Proteobacteria bacterium]|uniref:hypothetical protein n=1 Tax=Rudaea sp. TaxID=2136325 RepID=UPI00321F8552|nr:hypothetical protein [Pseudomonadota bacterium]
MAKYCKTCLGAICDHCKWFDYNGDEDGCYTGDGYCRLHKKETDPLGACAGYECRTLKEGDEWFDTGICGD